ncbi:MAG TPA: hypothetical protein VD758_06975 [Gemmatimonadaceae bacterium]|jgi:hypothetical protein|nr:hypothetical protein [Gemmatimonadaceae bacterium]
MADPRPRSKDFGAALAGLVLGGSVLFLIMLTIVWLTNSHFASEKAKQAKEPAQAVLPASGPAPSTTGTGTAAPVAPTASPASGTPSPAPAKK